MSVAVARIRLDAELVRRGLARSRDHATSLIARGEVSIAGRVMRKSAAPVAPDDEIVVSGDHSEVWVSRGAHKLLGALDAFDVSVPGKRCLDAGSSTGGFTEVLLRRGAREVVAVDVGTQQLAASLRADPRVLVRERTNLRALTLEVTDGQVDLVVADVSFISLSLIVEPMIAVCAPEGDLCLLVKPQFEVGKDRLGKGGVVRDPELRGTAVLGVAAHAEELGWGAWGVTTSPLPGPAGNVEFFLWLRRGPARIGDDEIRDEATRSALWGNEGVTR